MQHRPSRYVRTRPHRHPPSTLSPLTMLTVELVSPSPPATTTTANKRERAAHMQALLTRPPRPTDRRRPNQDTASLGVPAGPGNSCQFDYLVTLEPRLSKEGWRIGQGVEGTRVPDQHSAPDGWMDGCLPCAVTTMRLSVCSVCSVRHRPFPFPCVSPCVQLVDSQS